MIPRPMADWFVTTTVAKAGAVQQPDRVRRPRDRVEQLEPIEVSALFDERAVAIEEHRGPHQRAAPVISVSTAVYTRSGEMRLMQR